MMSPLENDTEVFIVRVWLERPKSKTAPAEWRGVVEHVGTKARHFFKEPDGMVAFITPYLERMGVDLDTPDP